MTSTRSLILAALGLVVACAPAWAQAPSASAQLAAENKQLATRYQADLQVCNSEASASGRMQCKRDAKSEYDKALAEAKARAGAPAAAKAEALCADCGRVTAVVTREKEGEPSAAGLIAGGIGGALLGRQVGGGSGRDLATLGGAAAGAYAGREIEKKVRSHTVWVVTVSFAGDQTAHYEFGQDPGYKTGDIVKKAGNSLTRP